MKRRLCDKLTKTEMIAKQAIKIEQQGYEIKHLRKAMRAIIVKLNCGGGPLNDNLNQYNNKQL